MKRLAVFCDGTWNDLRMPHLTNVARLAKCVKDCADDGETRQVVFYDSGVGVASRVSRTADFLVRMVGGAFGRGLNEKIEIAYRFLVLNYEPGDEIYVFGFSRGAYTARSLCGLIRKCGIVRRSRFDRIPEAIRLYRDRRRHPNEVSAFRREYSHGWPPPDLVMAQPHAPKHPMATGAEDLPEDDRPLWPARFPNRKPVENIDDGKEEHVDFKRLEARRAAPEPETVDKRIYKMMYLGLWDTVGALGLPSRFPFLARLFNRKYLFHDTDASSLITGLRHAAAVDEDRRVFAVTPVSNIDRLNRDWAQAMGLDVDDPARPNFVPYALRPYQQRWFPGDHGAIGGGNPEPGLSSGALLWIAQGAREQGLEFHDGPHSEIGLARVLRNPLANWRVERDGSPKADWKFDLLGFTGGYRDRVGPFIEDEVHPTAAWRVRQSPAYRPRPLERFTGERRKTLLYRTLAFWLFPPFFVALVAGLALLLAWAVLTIWLGACPAVEAIRDGAQAACDTVRGWFGR